MLFNSLPFAVFLPFVLLVYHRLSLKAQNTWLVFASWFFYAWWDPRFIILLLLTICLNFVGGLGISRSQNKRQRKAFMLASILGNLLILGLFKYFNFFIDSTVEISRLVGIKLSLPLLEMALPIGLSFYIFKCLSYVIEVYREGIPVCNNFITFALYVSYFPLLISGPIMDPARLIPVLENKRTITWDWVRQGLLLILIGIFKKVAIADALAPQVNLAFQYPHVLAGKDLLISLYLFAVQIYCDFSGYSDIARGVSKLFGIDLMINFNQPYFSASITEFWRKWHISLSTWFRTYIFFPLEHARRRHKILGPTSNALIVFLLIGLWHGAGWPFVVWGALHGLFLSLEKPCLVFWQKHVSRRIPGWLETSLNLFRLVFLFNLVSLTWIFFRSGNLSTAWTYLVGILTWRPSGGIGYMTATQLIHYLILILALIAIDIFQARANDHTVMLKWPWLARSFFYALLVILLIALGGMDAHTPFIYFQF